MPKLTYAPRALEDLQGVKTYVAKQFGDEKAKACIREITLEEFVGRGFT